MIPALVEVKNEIADKHCFDGALSRVWVLITRSDWFLFVTTQNLYQSNNTVYCCALCCLLDEIKKGIVAHYDDSCFKAKIDLFHDEFEKLANSDPTGSMIGFDGVCAKLFAEDSLLPRAYVPAIGEWILLSALQRCGALSLNTAILVCCSMISSSNKNIVRASI